MPFGQAVQEPLTGGRLGLLEVCALHGAMGPAERQTEFALFNEERRNNRHTENGFDYDDSQHLSRDEKIRVLVSTDVGSRGLDLHDVELVVMFDCPRNPTDFLHRAVSPLAKDQSRHSTTGNLTWDRCGIRAAGEDCTSWSCWQGHGALPPAGAGRSTGVVAEAGVQAAAAD